MSPLPNAPTLHVCTVGLIALLVMQGCSSGIPITVRGCYDGDTCRIDLPRRAFAEEWAYALFGHNLPLRLAHIDTPERQGRCAQESLMAEQAREFLHTLLRQADTVTLGLPTPIVAARGKYFRVVGSLLVDGQDVAAQLVSVGLAVPYEGGTKVKDWCEEIDSP